MCLKICLIYSCIKQLLLLIAHLNTRLLIAWTTTWWFLGYPLNYSCGQSGPVTCGKPVLRATVPSLCHVHSQKAQRSILQALKRAGLNLVSSSRPAPKFSVLLAECVNQIQARRKELDAAVNDVDYIDEEVCWCMIWFITALSLWWWQRTSLTWSGHHLDGKCSSVHGYVFRVWLKVCQYLSLSAELVYLRCSLCELFIGIIYLVFYEVCSPL